MPQPKEEYKGLSFFEYMRKRYKGENSARGDLAAELEGLYYDGIFVEWIHTYPALLAKKRLIKGVRAVRAITPALWIEYREASGTS